MAHCRGGCSPTPELRFRQVPGASVGGEGGEGGRRFPATPRVSTRGPCTECSSFQGHPPPRFSPAIWAVLTGSAGVSFQNLASLGLRLGAAVCGKYTLLSYAPATRDSLLSVLWKTQTKKKKKRKKERTASAKLSRGRGSRCFWKGRKCSGGGGAPAGSRGSGCGVQRKAPGEGLLCAARGPPGSPSQPAQQSPAPQ